MANVLQATAGEFDSRSAVRGSEAVAKALAALWRINTA